MFLRATWILAFCLLITQTVSATVTGTVTDTSGNPVTGAQVIYTDETNTDNSYSAYTDNDGRYEIKLAPTSVEDTLPSVFYLQQNYPNPFNPTTTIPFVLDKSSYVKLDIYNITGQHIATIVNGYHGAGTHHVSWSARDTSGRNLSAGVYLYRLKAGNQVQTKKMLLIDGGVSGSESSAIITENKVSAVSKAAKVSSETIFTVTVTGEDVFPLTMGAVTASENSIINLNVSRIKAQKSQQLTTGDDTTVFADDGAGVSIPAGTFSTVTDVSIKEAEEVPDGMIPEELEQLGSMYRFDITSDSAPQESIGLAVPCDTADIPSDVDPEDVLLGVWDGEQWVLSDIMYDSGNGMAVTEIATETNTDEQAAKVAKAEPFKVKYDAALFAFKQPKITKIDIVSPQYLNAATWDEADDLLFRIYIDPKNKNMRDYDVLYSYYYAGSIKDSRERGFILIDDGKAESTHLTFQSRQGFNFTGYSADPSRAGDDVYGAGFLFTANSFEKSSDVMNQVRLQVWVVPKSSSKKWVYSATATSSISYVNDGVLRVKPLIPVNGAKLLAGNVNFLGDAYEYKQTFLGKFLAMGVTLGTAVLSFGGDETVDNIDFLINSYADIASANDDLPTWAKVVSDSKPKSATLYIDDDNDPYNDPWKLYGKVQRKISLDLNILTYFSAVNLDLEPGRYWYGVELEGNRDAIERSAPVMFQIVEEEPLPELSITQPANKYTALEGQLISFTSTRAGTWYSSRDGELSGSTATFSTSNLSLGKHIISVESTEITPGTRFREVAYVAVTVEKKTNSSVSGHVVDDNGRAVAGTRVVLQTDGAPQITYTDENGNYTFNNVTDESPHIHVSPEKNLETITPDMGGGDVVIDDVVVIPSDGSGNNQHDIEGMTFITIPALTTPYVMNPNDGGDYKVTLSAFQMSSTVVTNAQYATYLTEALAAGDIEIKRGDVYGTAGDWSGQMYLDIDVKVDSDNQSWINYSDGSFTVASDRENRPVIAVTWYGAKAFAAYYDLELPTEAEWQYAASGGRNYAYGTDDGTIDNTKANYDFSVGYPVDVGSYPKNPFGLYDMCGNVCEWCNDSYGSFPSESVHNPEGPQTGSTRLIRGGTYYDGADYCRVTPDFRLHTNPESIGDAMGFRVVSRSSDSGGTGGGDPHDIGDITFVTIPGGTFRMGDIQNYGQRSNEKPVHDVTLSSFEMSIYEVTQGQYQSVIGTNPSYFKSGDDYPVETVSWYDAVKYCNKLSDAAGLERCYNESTWACDLSRNGFRLPTEAEWEYACRAGTETKFYTGNNLSSDGRTSTDLDTAVWYNGNSGSKTHAVGDKEPNAWGLFDMHGNVWEWCNDWYGESYYSSSPSSDPTGPSTGSGRVARGGGWGDDALYCRSAIRYRINPTRTHDLIGVIGFRVVRRP
ncbi:SUMF1/EgtB/PvdO family nonheme iron enzyme [Candidatus Latescibacterota bacterium]